jgi:hypothetical protein
MIPFDHSNISLGIYRAKAVKVDEPVIEILRIKSMRKPSYLQEVRLATGQKEYAATTYDFLYSIASQTLFTDLPKDKVASIVSSDNFNINVRLKPVNDKRKNKGHTSVLLSSPREYQFEVLGYPSEKYIGLSKKTLLEDDISILEDLIVKVNPNDMIYWRNKIDELRRANILEEFIQEVVKDNMRRPGFEPGF